MQANDAGKGYGRIVNIASVAGKEGNPNASAYGASKGAVMTLTKSLGKELAATGIRVNCVTPAAVDSPMFSQMKPEFIAFMLSKIPMGALGKPTRWRLWSPGCPPKTARSAQARCLIFRAGGRLIDLLANFH